ncbi:glycoside hydrolase family 27 protein [Granulicella sp. S190]|uniref:glycoside hydrolase family 27 protein n=1 Tax=Granulicella sp. S190 TaxID=1747226 RepID=UPI00352B064A
MRVTNVGGQVIRNFLFRITNDRPINPANLPTILGHLTAGFRLITTASAFEYYRDVVQFFSKILAAKDPMRLLNALTLALLLASLSPSHSKAQTKVPLTAATPPMGWNSWNFFAGKVTDKDIRDTADLLVSTGMRDAGYVYVNIDDTWQGDRDAQGVMHPNSKFPDMKALADYVHSKGLKLGIYSSPGAQTCAHFGGSLGHEQQDADLYASWGMDYLKYDLCSYRQNMLAEAPNDIPKQYKMMRDSYELMHQALAKAGRPIVYSLCQYGWDAVWTWGPSVNASLWRTTGDISPNFDRMSLIGREQAGLARFAGPGHWNDPDMLEVGNGKLTHDENVTHMSMWAMLAAPLIAGNNLTLMSPDIKSILTNSEVLAIDQDPLGHQAERIFAEGPIEIWSRPLKGGATALAIFNFSDSTSDLHGITLHLAEAGIKGSPKAHEIWSAKDLGPITDNTRFTLPGHSTILLKLTY